MTYYLLIKMNFSTKNNAFMKDKVYLEDYTNILDTCNKKCIKHYKYSSLSSREQLCLEKCFFKSLSFQKNLSQNFGDLMTQINES